MDQELKRHIIKVYKVQVILVEVELEVDPGKIQVIGTWDIPVEVDLAEINPEDTGMIGARLTMVKV